MIALVDCNNFYSSCERVFQPKLEGKPVIVLSNNDGCAISLSDEAKALGFKMGTPAFMAKDELEKAKVNLFSSNYTLYGDLSDRVMKTLFTFAPDVEVYSIDEAFINLSTFKHYNLYDMGAKIKQTVKQFTGIPVSVGIAPTKALAKMANRFAKKTKKQIGVHCMQTQEQIDEVLKWCEVGDIWGIGSQYKKLLIKSGFKTAYDFSKANNDWVRTNMAVVGLRLVKELQGISCIKWEDVSPIKKGIATAKGFGKLITDKEELKEAMSTYVALVAAKLRKDNTATKLLRLFVRTNPFRTQDKQYYQSVTVQLPVATNSTNELIHHALKGLELIFKKGYNYQKVGVMAFDVFPMRALQTGMFDAVNNLEHKIINKAMDKLNKRYGKDVIKFAAQGYSNKHKLRQEKLSPCYTTNINQLLTIRI